VTRPIHSAQLKLLDLLGFRHMERELDDKIGALGLQDHDTPDRTDSDEQRSAEKREQRNFTHSHLCQLAPELLGRILFLAQAPIDDVHLISSPWIEFDRGRVSYTLVCQYMRTVAIETPFLWKFIECDPFESPSSWTKLCVIRAKGYALDISIIPAPKTSWIDGERNINPEFRAYLAMARRVWLSLRKIGHFGSLRRIPAGFIFGELLAAPMPELRQVDGHMRGYRLQPGSLEGIAASLTRLCLDTVAFKRDGSFPHLPLLRYLRVGLIESGQPGAILAMIAHSRYLETLHIVLWGLPAGGVRPASRVQLPLLQDLRLEVTTEEQITCFFRSISIPKRSLYIHLLSPVSGNEEYMRTIGPYLLDFWAQAAGRQPFPDTTIMFESSVDSIVIGEKFRVDDVAPHLRLFCEAVYHTEDGLGEIGKLVHTLHILGPQPDRAPAERASSWPHVQHVIVDDVKCLPVGLDQWIRGRAEAGRPLESATFNKANPDVEIYAKGLQKDGLVGQVSCYPDR
jgi:hypothetical protein